MTLLSQNIQTMLTHLCSPRLLSFVIALIIITLISAGTAYIEYRTNWFAQRLGALLLSTNALRPQTGTLWKQILAQSQTQQSIDTKDPLPTPQTGLPEPVLHNHFAISRVPDTGPPGYVAIYKTPLANTDPNVRSLGDVINSLRIYRQGLAIVKVLHLPDVHFHAQIHRQVEDLYADLGDIQTLAPDTAIQVDSLGILDPNSLKAAVFAELAAEIIPNLRKRDHASMIAFYEKGNITQIFLNRDLGRFRGELHFEENLTPVEFEIDASTVAKIMNLPKTPDRPSVNE